MSRTKNTARKLKSQPQLTRAEIQRITEKVAVALEHSTEDMALLTLLFDHLNEVRDDYNEFFSAMCTIKTHLFIGTAAAEGACDQFQVDAYRNRGKLLLWPFERKESS